MQFTRKACNWFSMKAGFPDFFTPEMWYFRWSSSDKYVLYHIHDTPRTASPIFIRWLSKQAPVLWTLHDCSPITGGCLYPMNCASFGRGCGNCPQLHHWPLKTRLDFTKQMLNYKTKTARSGQIVPIVPSRWMGEQARLSGVFNKGPVHIPNSIDTKMFAPQRDSGRASEHIPQDRFVILMNVHNLADERKGIRDAIEAIRLLTFKPLVIAFGSASSSVQEQFKDIDLRCLGFVDNHALVAKFSAMADVLLYPTFADNLPNSVLETMACGTPTVGYRTGGMPDMVEHMVNGWLCETGDIARLAAGLEFAHSHPSVLRVWSEKCRELAIEKFSRKQFLNAHLALYRRVLESRN